MGYLVGDIKKLISLKFKTRDDSITDQYNRVLMVKVLMASILVTAMNWFKDELNCIVPEKLHGKELGKFVQQACWINGFYIYEELMHTPGFKGYYGVPEDLEHNGTYGGSEPWNTCILNKANTNCKPLTKLFYLQYQYFPFLLAAMAILYYLPYLLFYKVNSDLRSLKKELEKKKPNYEMIGESFFNLAPLDKSKSDEKHNIYRKEGRATYQKVVLNILIKIIHLAVNLCVFKCIDIATYGRFMKFFTKWIQWSKLPNKIRNNYVGERHVVNPGEMLLPTFGLCEVVETSLHLTTQITNEHQMVCELSQNIMYHYVLLALWLFIVVGVFVSIAGIIESLCRLYYPDAYFSYSEEKAREVYERLTSTRQKQYLDYVYKLNIERYGQLVRELYARMNPKDVKGEKDNENEEDGDEKDEKEKLIYKDTKI